MTKKMEKLREVRIILTEKIKELETHIFIEKIKNTHNNETQKMIIG